MAILLDNISTNQEGAPRSHSGGRAIIQVGVADGGSLDGTITLEANVEYLNDENTNMPWSPVTGLSLTAEGFVQFDLGKCAIRAVLSGATSSSGVYVAYTGQSPESVL